jgi:hypothetical protein
MIATPPVQLSASPAHVTLAAHEERTIRVTNAGRSVAFVDVVPAGFALGLRGRPRIVPRSRAQWLRVRPRRLALAPGRAASLTVSSRAAPPGRPGDHTALVLLRTGTGGRGGVAVRMQIGIVVVVRVPGAVVHRLRVQGARARRGVLELAFRNDGNVGEHLGPSRVRVALLRRGRVVARLRIAPRDLLPNSTGIASVVYRGRFRGSVDVAVEVSSPGTSARILRRTFRLPL